MSFQQQCIICGNLDAQLSDSLHDNQLDDYQYCHCPSCGRYIIPDSSYFLFDNSASYGNSDLYDKDKLCKYLVYNKINNRNAFIGTQQAFDKYIRLNPQSEAFLATAKMVEIWYPKTFVERIDYILLYLAKQTKFIGESLQISLNHISRLFFFENEVGDDNYNKELRFLMRYLSRQELIEHTITDDEFSNFFSTIKVTKCINITLSAKAWDKIYELQKNQSQNREVFVAMSFHESAYEIRAAIKMGIDNAKYSSLLMDEIVHNHQIVPEMLRLIKESRFMIMDISSPNFGAYYEAGYALGLGKEVIVTCKQEVWDKKDFSCDKDEKCYFKQIAIKPHFDIAQKQILVWKDYADLTKKLTEWIKHIVG